MASIDQLRSSQAMTVTRSNNNATSLSSKNTSISERGSQIGDSVSLSSQAKAVGQVHQQLATEPSFDSAKVAQIKEAISNGSYIIDADKLASNMIKFEDDLKGL